MTRDQLICWAAGFFEGEGTFQIAKEKSKGIAISSTDYDSLERLKENFKGKIYFLKKRKSNWKDAWIWTVQGKEAEEFYFLIKPFLLKRRSLRGEEWLLKRPKNKDFSEVIQMYNKGFTHKKIAEIMEVERSSISHFLNRRGLRRIKKCINKTF